MIKNMIKLIIVLLCGWGLFQSACSEPERSRMLAKQEIPPPPGPYRQPGPALSSFGTGLFKTFRYPPDAYLPASHGQQWQQEKQGDVDSYRQIPGPYGSRYPASQALPSW